MSEKELFPYLHDGSTQDEPWDHRFRPLAEILGCSDELAARAFMGLSFPEYETKDHLDVAKDQLKQLNRAATQARKLLREMKALNSDSLSGLRRRGTVTPEQIEYLEDVLLGKAKYLEDWYSGKNRKGGRNQAAYTVAEGVRRAFRRCRREIKAGNNDGAPSGPFGRAVETTIAAFGIRADWREPAEAARNKQNAIAARLSRLHARQRTFENLRLKYPDVPWGSVTFRRISDTNSDNAILLIDLDSPARADLRLRAGPFLAGNQATRNAIGEWLAD